MGCLFTTARTQPANGSGGVICRGYINHAFTTGFSRILFLPSRTADLLSYVMANDLEIAVQHSTRTFLIAFVGAVILTVLCTLCAALQGVCCAPDAYSAWGSERARSETNRVRDLGSVDEDGKGAVFEP